MTWMELHLLLKSMAEAHHTSLCDTPNQSVTIVIDREELCLDLSESMTTGKLHFNLMMDVPDDD